MNLISLASWEKNYDYNTLVSFCVTVASDFYTAHLHYWFAGRDFTHAPALRAV